MRVFVFFSYRLVIHSCIDGYTRKIVYVASRNNNRATTVYELFSNSSSYIGYRLVIEEIKEEKT